MTSNYERFHSGEDVEFHPEAESQGVRARLAGFDMESQNPYSHGTWMYKSFCSGWADADMAAANGEVKAPPVTILKRKPHKVD